MEISVRGLQNDITKPSINGGMTSLVDIVTHKLLKSDRTIRLFIPPQIRKMTPKLRHIYGCDICIVPEDTHIDLNIFITRPVTYLQKKSAGRCKRNSLFCTKSNTHYKNKVFPAGECLHGAIKDAAHCVTCIPI